MSSTQYYEILLLLLLLLFQDNVKPKLIFENAWGYSMGDEALENKYCY
jgi:hypothetical protein